ncbi:hypothetical protein LZ32DRAFT_327554 [Colletotrichum eremochloae]|nr:hypothetical protein LZ32DRAFT_327554 [Colletotrichum eremochloae]
MLHRRLGVFSLKLRHMFQPCLLQPAQPAQPSPAQTSPARDRRRGSRALLRSLQQCHYLPRYWERGGGGGPAILTHAVVCSVDLLHGAVSTRPSSQYPIRP